MSHNVCFQSPLASIRAHAGIYPVIDQTVFLADGARVTGNVTLKKGCSIWFNAVIRGDVSSISIDENTNIQDNAVIHGTFQKADVIIGSHVSIGHLAIVHGATILEGSLVGMQATILDHAVVGMHCLVGANALVPQGFKIPERSLVMGSPAKVMRQLTDVEIDGILATTKRYLVYAQGYHFG